MRDICEVRKRKKKNSYLAFLDIRLYDCVWREGLWHKMRQSVGWRQGGVEWREVKVVCGGKGA